MLDCWYILPFVKKLLLGLLPQSYKSLLAHIAKPRAFGNKSYITDMPKVE